MLEPMLVDVTSEIVRIGLSETRIIHLALEFLVDKVRDTSLEAIASYMPLRTKLVSWLGSGAKCELRDQVGQVGTKD